MLGLVGACVAGCAAEARAPAAAPAAGAKAAEEPAAEPATIEEAQAQLARARSDLGGWTGPGGAHLDSTSTTKPAEGEERKKVEQPLSTGDLREGPACATACRAIGSMKRAVDAICRMAGEADPRCTDARKTLADSVERTAGCGC